MLALRDSSIPVPPTPPISTEAIGRPEAPRPGPIKVRFSSIPSPEELSHCPSPSKPLDSPSSEDLDISHRAMVQSYNNKFEWYLTAFEERPMDTIEASAKLQGLGLHQLHELATDVYDELLRRHPRHHPRSPSYLMPVAQYAKERNQVRAGLSKLSQNMFSSLVSGVYVELKRRNPWIDQLPVQDKSLAPFQPFLVPTTSARDIHNPTYGKLDNFERQSTESFFTTKTHRSSTSTFLSAISSKFSIFSFYAGRARSANSEVQPLSPWRQFLESRKLIPDPLHEQDWSGRGQHAEFAAHEVSAIPLDLERVLGYSQTALVESVRCKRIRLARKTVRCRGLVKREDAIKEVEHLQRLAHSHIIRLVGTYVLGFDFCILLYPATEYNLETFMDIIHEERLLNIEPEDRTSSDIIEIQARRLCLWYFFSCLADAVHYIHLKATKHMDIKPKNLLVRDMRWSTTGYELPYKVYIADFGISRVYDTAFESNTDSPTPFTRAYAAPEVVAQETRGLSADIFSLGCVFVEILTTLASSKHTDVRQILTEIRENNPDFDTSFHANSSRIRSMLLDPICDYLPQQFPTYILDVKLIVRSMLEVDPYSRPTSEQVKEALVQGAHPCGCQHAEQEPFETAPEVSEVAICPVSNVVARISTIPNESKEVACDRSRAIVIEQNKGYGEEYPTASPEGFAV
ncbi:kinase-like protein [Glonium stellatum]|uniref:non-specific serine/threonine protein kinase n=1 Tax=Glonium stellatum TaxID=574774 RepID=A0A8E2FFG0_9PEZI|nr:kinase-like protein [Glonium stellatum]